MIDGRIGRARDVASCTGVIGSGSILPVSHRLNVARNQNATDHTQCSMGSLCARARDLRRECLSRVTGMLEWVVAHNEGTPAATSLWNAHELIRELGSEPTSHTQMTRCLTDVRRRVQSSREAVRPRLIPRAWRVVILAVALLFGSLAFFALGDVLYQWAIVEGTPAIERDARAVFDTTDHLLGDLIVLESVHNRDSMPRAEAAIMNVFTREVAIHLADFDRAISRVGWSLVIHDGEEELEKCARLRVLWRSLTQWANLCGRDPTAASGEEENGEAAGVS